MEYIRGGTLKQLIDDRYKDTKAGFTEAEASAIMKYIFIAVNYIHSAGISHRDLKPGIVILKETLDLIDNCYYKQKIF